MMGQEQVDFLATRKKWRCGESLGEMSAPRSPCRRFHALSPLHSLNPG
jgi:MOSC domain-containing protein YiiM